MSGSRNFLDDRLESGQSCGRLRLADGSHVARLVIVSMSVVSVASSVSSIFNFAHKSVVGFGRVRLAGQTDVLLLLFWSFHELRLLRILLLLLLDLYHLRVVWLRLLHSHLKAEAALSQRDEKYEKTVSSSGCCSFHLFALASRHDELLV